MKKITFKKKKGDDIEKKKNKNKTEIYNKNSLAEYKTKFKIIGQI